MLDAEDAERYRDSMRAAAFVGWQIGRQTGAIKDTTSFEKYLRNFGLTDEPSTLTSEQRKAIAAKALAEAERIRASDVRRREKLAKEARADS